MRYSPGRPRTSPAIDTFVGMDDQHVLALVKAIHGVDFYTIHQLTFDATLIDYIGHLSFLPDGQASQWRTRRHYAALRPVLREYIVSEAMAALGILTNSVV
jgi:hypothetical protein